MSLYLNNQSTEQNINPYIQYHNNHNNNHNNNPQYINNQSYIINPIYNPTNTYDYNIYDYNKLITTFY